MNVAFKVYLFCKLPLLRKVAKIGGKTSGRLIVISMASLTKRCRKLCSRTARFPFFFFVLTNPSIFFFFFGVLLNTIARIVFAVCLNTRETVNSFKTPVANHRVVSLTYLTNNMNTWKLRYRHYVMSRIMEAYHEQD